MDEQESLSQSYDPIAAAEVATRLQNLADSIVTGTLIVFALGGLLMGASAGFTAAGGPGALVGVLEGGFLGALLGRNIGETRAIDIRWKTQSLLTLTQIEQNTRPVKTGTITQSTMSRTIPAVK